MFIPKSRTLYKNLRAAIGSGPLAPHAVRLVVLYEDLRLELVAASEERLEPLDKMVGVGAGQARRKSRILRRVW